MTSLPKDLRTFEGQGKSSTGSTQEGQAGTTDGTENSPLPPGQSQEDAGRNYGKGCHSTIKEPLSFSDCLGENEG